MKPESPDPTLASFFERQRNADRAAAPSFARLSSVMPPVPRGRRRHPLLLALAAIAAPVLAVSLFPLRTSHHESTVSPLPQAFAQSVAWSSATDSLLPDDSAAPIVSLTSLNTAWTDELLPASPTTATND